MVLSEQPWDGQQVGEETNTPNLPLLPCWPQSHAVTDTSNFPSERNSC